MIIEKVNKLSLVNKIITVIIFPLVFISSMIIAVHMIKDGYHPVMILTLISICTAIIIIFFERINPEYIEWNISGNDIITDSLHLLVSHTFIPRFLEISLYVTLFTISLNISNSLDIKLWPNHWNIFFQLIIAMLISQFGEYWMHRSMHENTFLWKFHATHHSPNRLYWLNAARFHPIDALLINLVTYIPLILLGANVKVLLLVSIWINVHGLFQHCNIHLRLGPLNYIFSMCELHRWHHSRIESESNANYGNNIIFWDFVFGTMYYPKNTDARKEIGLIDIIDFPKNYIQQILSPFKWDRISGAK
jgi:sterol desaturase/sphingolipid hydroxylase (fatty acid hydroxylase superfamily)